MYKEYRMVASDLDGTLLDESQVMSMENTQAIAELTRRGIHFVPSTGRCLGEMPKDVMDCPWINYYITSDGAAIYDKSKGRVTISRYIPAEVTDQVLDIIKDYDCYPMVHSGTVAYCNARIHNESDAKRCRVNPYFMDLINRTNVKLENFDTEIRGRDNVEIFCIFFATDEELEACRARFAETGKLCVVQSAKDNLEIYSIDAGKGRAVLALADMLKINADEIIAVGDSKNDLSLIETAGLGLAMENACDELKACADDIICNFKDHSARYILANYF